MFFFCDGVWVSHFRLIKYGLLPSFVGGLFFAVSVFYVMSISIIYVVIWVLL